MHLARQDIDAAHHVPVRHKPTQCIRAAIHAPTGFVLVPACWTGLAGAVLIDELNGDASGLRLVGDVLPDLAVRPQANLLLALGRQALAVGHVAHISNGEPARFALDGIVLAALLAVPAFDTLMKRNRRWLAICAPLWVSYTGLYVATAAYFLVTHVAIWPYLSTLS